MLTFIRSHLLALVFISLGVLFVGSSYVRFIILNDYLVSYEVDCNPANQNCFIGCDDDDCLSTYPYYIVEKTAKELETACGSSVQNCAAAAYCLPSDTSCTVTLCEPATDECYHNEMADNNEVSS